MAEQVERTIEIERAVNLLRGFGWEKISEIVEGDRIALTFEKSLQSPAPSESATGPSSP